MILSKNKAVNKISKVSVFFILLIIIFTPNKIHTESSDNWNFQPSIKTKYSNPIGRWISCELLSKKIYESAKIKNTDPKNLTFTFSDQTYFARIFKDDNNSFINIRSKDTELYLNCPTFECKYILTFTQVFSSNIECYFITRRGFEDNGSPRLVSLPEPVWDAPRNGIDFYWKCTKRNQVQVIFSHHEFLTNNGIVYEVDKDLQLNEITKEKSWLFNPNLIPKNFKKTNTLKEWIESK
ncbi:hypothetical protein EHQ23_02405 [Leptospira bourretii]|uniref:Uncharacterized protein n=1 Tax=Leptospira bourretii TaxID=2484962 RepID=A0A4R9IPQ7_9LEPT|nr:hypothetical protein [Leptospira bourretii]TGK89988.1 hypothetical protein EHQ23_02405 [Leptospira bourretii]TGK92211.1 hypothetical protein EHQ26_09550 [Leptospira bourretii]TGL27490.1 hypothetical protein EHQ45_17500 [Leptospira bourretii]